MITSSTRRRLSFAGMARRMRGRASQASAQSPDDGFVLLEAIITISLITIIMTALASFFLTAVASTSQQRARQTAAQAADSTVGNLRGRHSSDLLTGHDASSVSAQFSAASAQVQSWNATMLQAVDSTAAAGAGTNAGVSTAAQTTGVNNVSYTTTTYLGWCWIPTDGSSTACTAAAMPSGWTSTSSATYTTATQYLRAVVAVTWRDRHCTSSTCTYVTSTLISADDDPTFNLNQTPPAVPVVTPPGDQIFAADDSVNLQLKVNDGTGVPLFLWTITSGSLPHGLNMNQAGLITGTPDIPQSSSAITVKVSDAFVRTATATFRWTILQALTITTVTPARADYVGVPVTIALAATGGTGGGYTWTASGLPPGITLSSGTVSGTATTKGVYPTTITVADSSGTRTKTATFTWTVNYPPLNAVTPNAQTDTVNSPTSGLQLSTTGGSGSYTYIAVGPPPPGITMSSSGLFTGVPTTTGSTTVTVNIIDSTAGLSTPITFDWQVFNRPAVSAPTSFTTTLGASLSVSLASSCANSPCTYTLNNGPSGVSVNSAGVLGGTVGGTARSYTTATVTITDADHATTTTGAFTITVNAPPTLTNPGTQTVTPSTVDNLDLSTLASGGTGTLTYSVSGLPIWLTYSTTTGIIQGTSPSGTGSSNVVATVTDSTGVSTTVSFKWIVSTLGWSAIPTQSSTLNKNYTTATGLDVTAYDTGGTAPYTYSATGLPTGLSLSSAGKVTGTASVKAVFNPVITVVDSVGANVSSTAFVWVVGVPALIPSATPWSVTTARNGTPSQTIGYACPVATCTVTVSGTPSGIGLKSSAQTTANATTTLTVSSGVGSFFLNGQVSGSAPQQAYAVILTIKDGNNATATTSGTWTVS